MYKKKYYVSEKKKKRIAKNALAYDLILSLCVYGHIVKNDSTNRDGTRKDILKTNFILTWIGLEHVCVCVCAMRHKDTERYGETEN